MDLVHPVPTVSRQQDSQLVPPEVNFVDHGLVTASTQNDILEFSSVGLSGPAAEIASEAEESNPIEPSHAGAGIPGEHLESVPGKLVINYLIWSSMYSLFD